jgi:hypothetical protein
MGTGLDIIQGTFSAIIAQQLFPIDQDSILMLGSKSEEIMI